jgi:hypothetical protein
MSENTAVPQNRQISNIGGPLYVSVLPTAEFRLVFLFCVHVQTSRSLPGSRALMAFETSFLTSRLLLNCVFLWHISVLILYIQRFSVFLYLVKEQATMNNSRGSHNLQLPIRPLSWQQQFRQSVTVFFRNVRIVCAQAAEGLLHFNVLSLHELKCISFTKEGTPQPHYPQGKSLRCPLDRRLGGPQSRLWTTWRRENSWPYRDSELRPLGRPARS